MSNRKNKIEYIITGIHYYNEPYIRRGFIKYDKIIKAKQLLKDVSDQHYWGKEVIYCGLYDFNDLNNPEIKEVINEMFGQDFIHIDKIELIRNTKTIDIENL